MIQVETPCGRRSVVDKLHGITQKRLAEEMFDELERVGNWYWDNRPGLLICIIIPIMLWVIFAPLILDLSLERLGFWACELVLIVTFAVFISAAMYPIERWYMRPRRKAAIETLRLAIAQSPVKREILKLIATMNRYENRYDRTAEKVIKALQLR